MSSSKGSFQLESKESKSNLPPTPKPENLAKKAAKKAEKDAKKAAYKTGEVQSPSVDTSSSAEATADVALPSKNKTKLKASLKSENITFHPSDDSISNLKCYAVGYAYGIVLTNNNNKSKYDIFYYKIYMKKIQNVVVLYYNIYYI